MLLKIHKAYREVVALCDKELIGKTFEEGKTHLEVNNFYNGESVDESKAIETLIDKQANDACFNIVGKRSCNAAIKAGIINKEAIKTIQEVPTALSLF